MSATVPQKPFQPDLDDVLDIGQILVTKFR